MRVAVRGSAEAGTAVPGRRLPVRGRGFCLACSLCMTGNEIKRDKGIWWMPWRVEAMKDVALCDKLRGGESNL